MISVIVPIYNAAQYISRAIDSVLAQDQRDFELILINDGSTDNSLDICNQYVQKDRRIHVVDQKNNGVSSARNSGLQHSKGDYVCFIDADDWVGDNYLSALLAAVSKSNFDFAISNIKKHLPHKILDGRPFTKKMLKSETFAPEDFFEKENFILGNPPFGKLFKKSIIEKYQLRFDETLKNGEDFIFVLQYALQCKSIIFVNEYTYNYNLQSESSVTQKYFKNYYQHLKNTKDAYFRIVEKYGNISEEEKLYQYFRVASKAVLEEGKVHNGMSFAERYKSIKTIVAKSEIIKFRKNYNLKKDDSQFFFFVQNLIKYDQPLMITLFLTLYFKLKP